jgi:hypothetical protein
VRDALAGRDENDWSPANVDPLVAIVNQVTPKDRGLAIDTLYEIGSVLCVNAARHALTQNAIDAPHMWRYAKSVLKRAMLRHDVVTFGWLAHGVEHVGRTSKGTTATVKSGYDGEMRETKIFGRRTQDYVRRACGRYLKMLGRHRPSWYAYAAAETIVHYTSEDEDDPSLGYGSYARCYFLHRVLYGSSKRYAFVARRMRFRIKGSKAANVPSGVREEAFPDLWDATPRAYVRLLSGAKLVVVHEFAIEAVRRAHMDAVREATHAEIVGFVGAPYPPTVDLGLEELRRRFNPNDPDWSLLTTLIADKRPNVRDLGLEWLGATARMWATDAARVMQFLSMGDATTREAVAGHVVPALRDATPEARRAIAAALLEALRGKETEEGAHAAHAQIAAALAAEIGAAVPLHELLVLLLDGSDAAKGVAARAIATKPGAAEAFGVDQLVAMSVHELVAIREAARGLLRQITPTLKRDPSTVYTLLECEWADTRTFAIDFFKSEVDVTSLPTEAIVGLCDSNRVDVQDLGKHLIERRMESLDPQDLIKKLSQHPHRNMRKWVSGLIVKHLKAGLIPLAGLEEFFRTVLLDTNPDRAMKHAIVGFLAERGLADERQAEIAGRLLGEFVRSKTKDDLERAIIALTKIKMAYPSVDASISVRGEGK